MMEMNGDYAARETDGEYVSHSLESCDAGDCSGCS